MNKLLIMLLACTLGACAATNNQSKDKKLSYNTLVVDCNGKTEQLAQQECFKKAVQTAIGLAVRTEQIVVNDTVKENYILTHSSGYIDKFRIIDSETTPNKIYLTMEVHVKPTLIEDYLIRKTDNKQQIDGEYLATNIDTFANDRKTGDELIQSVLKDYPHNALELKAQPVEFKMDKNRNLYAEVIYELKWKDSYLKSLSQVLNQVKEYDCKIVCPKDLPHFKLVYKNNDSDFMNNVDTYYFKDFTRPVLISGYYRGQNFPAVKNKIDGKVTNARYVIKVDFLDDKKIILNTACYSESQHTHKNYNKGDKRFVYSSQDVIKDSFAIYIKMGNQTARYYNNLKKYSQINVAVVRPDMCQEI